MKTARCPITGQVGVCPSMAVDAPSTQLSSKDQQAHLWETLLERNGHEGTVKIEGEVDEDGPLPELIHASSKSFSDESSDSGSEDTSAAFSVRNKTNEAKQERSWPTYDQVSAHVLVADYREHLTSPADLKEDSTKLLCPHGAVCQARLEFFEGHRYTGLLAPGSTAEHCLVRLSSALRPVDHGTKSAFAQAIARRTFGAKLCASQILPAAAIKLFRGNGMPSGNILLMGSKVGQAQRNFFEHGLCTAVTEKIPALGIPFLRRFSRYSKYPLALGLSELCQYDAQGEETDTPTFPFALFLQPVAQLPVSDEEDRPFDAFIDDVQEHLQPETHLFDIFAAPTPESVSCQLERIGRVVSTSRFIYSSPTDGLTFRHQVKEDDLNLQPNWEQEMHAHTVQQQDGSQGTVAKLTGWQICEELVTNGNYVNYEQRAKKSVSFEEPSVAIPGWTFCGFQKARVQV